MDVQRKLVFEACMKLAEYFNSQYNQRRQYQWKVTFGVWTLLVGGIVFIKKPSSVQYWLAAILTIVYIWFYLKPLWQANEKDKYRAKYYRIQAESILLDPLYELTENPSLDTRKWTDLRFLRDWSMRFQTIATIVLTLLFCLAQR